MKFYKLSPAWLVGTVTELQLTRREAVQVCQAFGFKPPRLGYVIDLPTNWFGMKTLANYGKFYSVLFG